MLSNASWIHNVPVGAMMGCKTYCPTSSLFKSFTTFDRTPLSPDDLVAMTRDAGYSRLSHPRRLKNCTARSCRSAAARFLKVPRFRRLPVRGLGLREYSQY